MSVLKFVATIRVEMDNMIDTDSFREEYNNNCKKFIEDMLIGEPIGSLIDKYEIIEIEAVRQDD